MKVKQCNVVDRTIQKTKKVPERKCEQVPNNRRNCQTIQVPQPPIVSIFYDFNDFHDLIFNSFIFFSKFPTLTTGLSTSNSATMSPSRCASKCPAATLSRPKMCAPHASCLEYQVPPVETTHQHHHAEVAGLLNLNLKCVGRADNKMSKCAPK